MHLAVSQQLTPVFPVNWYILMERVQITRTWQQLIRMKSVEDPVYDGSLDWNKHAGECSIETNFTLKGCAPSFVEGRHLLRVQRDRQHHFSATSWFLARITWAGLTAVWSQWNHYGFFSPPGGIPGVCIAFRHPSAKHFIRFRRFLFIFFSLIKVCWEGKLCHCGLSDVGERFKSR